MGKAKPAPIGVALIAKNAAKTLPACLASIRPHVAQIVVGVDTFTTDKTAKVARMHGADVVVPVQVSDWHECEQHGKVLAQHFAQARNESFKHLDKRLPWHMWVDSDDVVDGAEHLPKVVESVPEFVSHVWLPYVYGRVSADGPANTVFDRERILRSSVGWEWRYRVHEVVVPQGPGQPTRTDAVKIVHQHGVHKAENSALRNLLLLEIDYEQDPSEPRTVFYLGNQYFAMGRWAEAAYWYERYAETGSHNVYELWQSNCYLSRACQRLGNVDGARDAAYAAMDVRPEHPEPYFLLAEAYAMAGEDDKVEFWTRLGRERELPPAFVFKNPMDYQFNNRVILADAYARQGRAVEARQELEAAYSVHPDERVGQSIQRYREIEDAAQKATAFVQMAEALGPEWAVQTGPVLPETVREFGRARDVYVPLLLGSRPNTQPRIVFWCGRSMEPWYPGTLNTTGIGGSETAVVEIAHRFARDGWRVDVYNGAGRHEEVHAGVGYWDPERLQPGNAAEALVSWRNPGVHALPLDAQARLLWCHDLNYGPQVAEDMQAWDRVLGVSDWHAGMLKAYYGLSSADFVPNGIDPTRFDPSIKKVPFRCVYASSPDRGLARLLSLWPKIVADEPGAELHVAYGWENVDRWIAAGRQDLAAFKAEVVARLEKTPQVVWRGRLPQDELARLYSESYLWLYPTSFLEVSCISAMEAMAGGAVPVTSAAGALRETVGSFGAVVNGNPHSRAWGDFYVNVARGMLTDPSIRVPLSNGVREHAKQYTWDAAYVKWKQVVEDCLSGKPSEKEMVAA